MSSPAAAKPQRARGGRLEIATATLGAQCCTGRPSARGRPLPPENARAPDGKHDTAKAGEQVRVSIPKYVHSYVSGFTSPGLHQPRPSQVQAFTSAGRAVSRPTRLVAPLQSVTISNRLHAGWECAAETPANRAWVRRRTENFPAISWSRWKPVHPLVADRHKTIHAKPSRGVASLTAFADCLAKFSYTAILCTHPMGETE